MNESSRAQGLAGLERLAHDLRGPLAPIRTAVYLLRSGELDGTRQEELHELLDRQARRMGTMIDELDDWLRASQGRLVGPASRLEPVQLLEVAMTGAGCAGGEAAEIDDDALLATVSGDQRRIVQMLHVLLEHARERGSGSLPRVRVHCDGAVLVIDVMAVGGGADDAGSLLEAPTPDPGEDSLGLRLLVARAIALAHGGSIEAVDDAGQLRLRCTLPLAGR